MPGTPRPGPGKPAAGLEIRRRVGYVPERPTMYEWMTAAEIGWFTAGFYAEGFEQRFRDARRQVRACRSSERYQMSKGMRAKVVLSLAMAHRARAAHPRRTDFGARHARPPRILGEHGRCRRRRPHGPPLEPPIGEVERVADCRGDL